MYSAENITTSAERTQRGPGYVFRRRQRRGRAVAPSPVSRPFPRPRRSVGLARARRPAPVAAVVCVRPRARRVCAARVPVGGHGGAATMVERGGGRDSVRRR